MKLKFIVLYIVILCGIVYTQPQFSVKTVNGFDNFKLGINFAEPFIATNPNNPLNSACIFYTLGYNTQVYYTIDGHQWNFSPLNFGYYNAGADPFIATDKFGNFYITVLTGFPSFNGFSVAKSTNGGINWNYYRVFDGVLDKECIAGDITNGPFGGNVYTAWQDIVNDSAYMSFSRSTSGGVSWLPRIRVNNSDNDYCPYLAIGANGNIDGGSVYYGYNSADNSGVLSAKIRRSTNGGVSFSNEVIAATGIFNPQPIKGMVYATSCIQIAADNSNTSSRGNVYIVYATNPAGSDNSDVYFTRSTDLGVTWETPRKLNDDNTTTEQWMPAISCDKETGKVFATWFDSRFDPLNIQIKLYGTVSSDGGVTFAPNSPISNEPFIINGTNFWGHYMGVSAINNTSYACWNDGRENTNGSYTAFYPDYALIASEDHKLLSGNDSFNVSIRVPAKTGPFIETVKFSVALESLPPQGNISALFVNNRDSVSIIPDSVMLKIRTSGNVTPGRYRLIVNSRAVDGVPVHKRAIELLVNYSFISVGTNRNGLLNFIYNGNTYTSTQESYVANNTVITVGAPTPQIFNFKKYHFLNWSDGGDTMHSVTLNNSYLNIRAQYKVQFKLIMDTAYGHAFGGNVFYDSAQNVSFGVTARNINVNGNQYRFAGWNGNGSGSYTSADSLGNDTLVNLNMYSVITENPRWISLIGITPLSNEVPKEFKLYNNFPNPFNPVTKIIFDIARNTKASLVVYDILGKEVRTIIHGDINAGKYEITFDGSSLSSGIYFYKLITNDFVDTKKMLMVK